MSLRVAARMEGVERTLIRRIFDAAPPDAINLGLGQPDLPTPPRVALAGVRAIAEGRTGYTSTAGGARLREAIASQYRGFARGPEDVVVTVGSQEANFATLMALVDAGDEVLYPEPGYPAYPMMARLLGATPVAYPVRAERGFRIDPEEVGALLSDRTRAVIVCSPSNPTGAVEAPDDLERLAELLAAREVPWISDEVYSGFTYDAPFRSMREFSPRGGIVVSGLSKVFAMTGWRLGWAAGPSAFIARVTAAHQYLVNCAPSISQAAAESCFGAAAEEDRLRYLDVFRRRRDLMAEEIDRIPGVRFSLPGGAFYFFVDVSKYGTSLSLTARVLERRGVLTIPGVAFGGRGEGFVRLSFAAGEGDIVRGVRAFGEEIRRSPSCDP